MRYIKAYLEAFFSVLGWGIAIYVVMEVLGIREVFVEDMTYYTVYVAALVGFAGPVEVGIEERIKSNDINRQGEKTWQRQNQKK
jgi:hypothetical protein